MAAANSPQLTLVIVDVRSAHNVGTMLRTADACGVGRVFLVGLTPTPRRPADTRPGHVIAANTKAIAKSALGAESTVAWEYYPDLPTVIATLRRENYRLYALECNRQGSQSLFSAAPASHIALIVGSETTGLDQATCDRCDATLEIPMHGHKGSLNVAVAAGIGLYALRQTRDH